ncbi:MAG: ribosome maturation factor RimM [Rhodocyclaceae bacterium]|nr:MAG: ribosome maturation factor RimM [Rhodocyclaceae bacterium]
MVVLGRLVAPYGVKGWLHLHPFGDDPESWRGMSRWWLGKTAEGAEWSEYGLDSIKLHGDGWVVKFMGIDDRSGAESLVGRFVASPKEDLPKTAEGEYYWADLIGLQVVNESGAVLGHVASLIETGANDVLVVREGEGKAAKERLLPFVDAVIRKVDVAAGNIQVEWGVDW